MKNFLSIALLLCLILCFCSCEGEVKTDSTDSTTATTAATEETTATEATTAITCAVAQEITQDEAVDLVKAEYEFGDGYSYYSRGLVEVDGVEYYAVDLKKVMDTHSTYMTTYFVTTNGAEILEGYYQNDVPTIVTEITEDEAVDLVKTEYEFGDEYTYYSRGLVEVDGVEYYAVDLKKVMDTHSTYMTTYFVTTDGAEILEGYYQNDVPTIVE